MTAGEYSKNAVLRIRERRRAGKNTSYSAAGRNHAGYTTKTGANVPKTEQKTV
jgi:hypothetical protein